MKQTEDLKVFISTSDRDFSCCECGEALGRGAGLESDMGGKVYLRNGKTIANRELYCVTRYSGKRSVSRSMQPRSTGRSPVFPESSTLRECK